MSRYIDADALIKDIESRRLVFKDTITVAEALLSQGNAIRKAIDEAPTADVVEVRHGTWYHCGQNGVGYAECSACRRRMNIFCYGYAYCSLCGAKMDGERKD